jgi:hypothetical protein
MEDEMGWACSTHKIRHKCKVFLESLNGSGHVDDLGADWRIIFKCIAWLRLETIDRLNIRVV